MTSQDRQQFWQQRIDAQQVSGLSGVAFCKQRDLNKANAITRIGGWDPARRKFVEADKSVNPKAKTKTDTPSKTDVALGYIRKLYRVESSIDDKTDEERLQAWQAISVPVLNEFKLGALQLSCL